MVISGFQHRKGVNRLAHLEHQAQSGPSISFHLTIRNLNPRDMPPLVRSQFPTYYKTRTTVSFDETSFRFALSFLSRPSSPPVSETSTGSFQQWREEAKL